MVVVCAWCKKTIRGDRMWKKEPVSHGICKECEDKVRAEIRDSLESGDPSEVFPPPE